MIMTQEIAKNKNRKNKQDLKIWLQKGFQRAKLKKNMHNGYIKNEE